jgi:hypothetical protein
MKRLFLFLMVLTLAAVAADERERVIMTFSAPVKFEKRDEATFLTIADEKRKVNLIWSYEMRDKQTMHLIPAPLEEGKIYEFALEHERVAGGVLINPQLVSIAQGGRVLYDRTLCRVHQKKMERKEVPIVYGLAPRRPEDPPHEVETKLFPFRLEVAYAGCIPGPRKTELVFVCPDCKAAHVEWTAKNPAK